MRGSGGIFIVTADGQQVFSKRDEGRFPTESEIVEILQNLSRAKTRDQPEGPR